MFWAPEMNPNNGSQVCPKGKGFTAKTRQPARVQRQQQHRNVLNCARQLPVCYHTLAAAPSVTPLTTIIPPLPPDGCHCRDGTAR
jgi:hypothetical protein